MPGAPGAELLPPRDRDLFTQHFEQDLHFFQLLLLLFKRSCPIRNLDLVWSEPAPSGQAGSKHLGTTEALASPWSRWLGLRGRNPHPAFCNIINDRGRREAESCGVSDRAAETIVRRTGKPYVYQCHFGLTDIAVPVIVKGRHIATLFTGQVLCSPPTQDGFAAIAKKAAKLGHVNLKALEGAYWKVPVVSQEDIRNTTQIVQAFAQYLGSSWLRLAELLAERGRRDREVELARKELAHWIVGEGQPDRNEISRLMRTLRFHRPPNRVLVAKLHRPEGYTRQRKDFEIRLAAAHQAVQDVCDGIQNASPCYLPSTGLCVSFHDPEKPHNATSDLYARRLAHRILYALRESRADQLVRVGIGRRRNGWEGLRQSFREACTALACSNETIAQYHSGAAGLSRLFKLADELRNSLAAGKVTEARDQADALSAAVCQRYRSPRDLSSARLFFCATLDSACFAARELGCNAEAIASLHERSLAEIERASTLLEAHDAWVGTVLALIQEVRLLHSGKREKIVERAVQLIRGNLQGGRVPAVMTIGAVAAALGLSSGHLGRIFKQRTGQTFERFLMQERIELAKRLLLDPVNSVSEVAQRCGYADLSYFSRVFRKLVGCSPREFCENPASFIRRDDPPPPRTGDGTVVSVTR